MLFVGRWTSFERAEGCLIKPDSACIDIGRFTVDAAYEAATGEWGAQTVSVKAVRIGEKPLADKKMEEIRGQASYCNSQLRGTLGTLISGTRGPPLTHARRPPSQVSSEPPLRTSRL